MLSRKAEAEDSRPIRDGLASTRSGAGSKGFLTVR
jgi:hypothetical protein